MSDGKKLPTKGLRGTAWYTDRDGEPRYRMGRGYGLARQADLL